MAKEPWDAFMVRMRANQHFVTDQSTQHPTPTRRNRRVGKMLARIHALTQAQRTLLYELVTSKRWLTYIRSEPYAVARTEYGWSIKNMDGEEHSVNADATVCSCPDCKFRQRVCKHLEAIQCFCRRS